MTLRVLMPHVARAVAWARHSTRHIATLLAQPERARRALVVAGVVLSIIALVAPPVSLIDRLTSRGHTTLLAAAGGKVPADGGGAVLEVGRRDIYRTTRVRVSRRSHPAGRRAPRRRLRAHRRPGRA